MDDRDRLRVDEVAPALLPGGRLLLLAAPGPHAAGLDDALGRLRRGGVDVLVSLLEPEEAAGLGVADLREGCARAGIEAWSLPTPDGCAPQLDRARDRVARIVAALASGRTVAVCCRGGLGRTGTLAACTLVGVGLAPGAAIAAVRAARPGAIETAAQERAVHAFARPPC